MNLTEELHETLKGMMKSIEAGPVAKGPGVVDYLKRLDKIKEDMGDDVPQMLEHYLDKRSYAKALDFLEGRDERVAPNC